jgi:hypothetical protein
MKGEFSPGDPAIYRGNQRNHTNSLVSGHPFQTKANDRIDTRIHADMHVYESHPPNSMYPMDSQGGALYRGSEIPPRSVNMQSSYATNKSTEHDLKLRQLEELMYKNFPPKIAAQLFDQQAHLPNTPNNDSYLESLLNWLRTRSGSV